MKKLFPVLAACGLTAASLPVLADTIPYNHAGTVAPQVNTYASSSAGINIYYYGSTAGYTDYVEVYDMATGYDSGQILNNKTTSVGTKITVGTTPGQINAGDQLIFYIDSPDGKFASLASYSADGTNHAYITTYSGGNVNGVAVPAGLYVGMEDLTRANSDLNYNDDDFIFSGVSTATTAEPASLMLTATGLLACVLLLRRRTMGTRTPHGVTAAGC